MKSLTPARPASRIGATLLAGALATTIIAPMAAAAPIELSGITVDGEVLDSDLVTFNPAPYNDGIFYEDVLLNYRFAYAGTAATRIQADLPTSFVVSEPVVTTGGDIFSSAWDDMVTDPSLLLSTSLDGFVIDLEGEWVEGVRPIVHGWGYLTGYFDEAGPMISGNRNVEVRASEFTQNEISFDLKQGTVVLKSPSFVGQVFKKYPMKFGATDFPTRVDSIATAAIVSATGERIDVSSYLSDVDGTVEVNIPSSDIIALMPPQGGSIELTIPNFPKGPIDIEAFFNTIDAGQTAVGINATSDPDKAHIAFGLVDLESSEPLTGGSFTVASPSGEVLYNDATAIDGLLMRQGAPLALPEDGTYTLVQNTAPVGYIIDDTAHRLTASNNLAPSLTIGNLRGEVPEDTIFVIPLTPVVSTPKCDELATVVLPNQEGVDYTEVADGDTVTVIATPREGYGFSEGAVAQWILEIPAIEACDDTTEESDPDPEPDPGTGIPWIPLEPSKPVNPDGNTIPWTPLEPSTPGEENGGEESIPLVPLEPSKPAPTSKPTPTPTPEPSTDITNGKGQVDDDDDELAETGFEGVMAALGAASMLILGTGAVIAHRRKMGAL